MAPTAQWWFVSNSTKAVVSTKFSLPLSISGNSGIWFAETSPG